MARRSHPAPYPKFVLDRMALWLGVERRAQGRPLRILDPFAGIGRIHDLPKRVGVTVGVEIEEAWASARSATIVGDATALPDDWAETFDAVATSPTYANRLADKHDAKDACFDCKGTGTAWTEDGCPDVPMFCPSCGVACTCGSHAEALRSHVAACKTCRRGKCPNCGGAGVSRRYTYKHSLGRMPSPGSSAVYGWTGPDGDAYRDLHKRAWAEAWRVLRPGGLMLVNVKNHIRGGAVQYVAEWHEQTLRDTGFTIVAVQELEAPGLRQAGENADVRVPCERIIVGRK